MSRLRLREVVVVEGKYDAIALEAVIDGLIIATDGFSVFSDNEKKDLLRELGRRRGLLILTDSDAAGFAIRHYIEKIAAGCVVKHAYIPAVQGKEGRKATPSKEGTLGVEGMPLPVLRAALQQAGIEECGAKTGEEITYTHLYRLGISGTAGSAVRRRELLNRVGLPQRLSKKALCQVLSSLYSYQELQTLLQPKPALFWDFHGTLTLPDIIWFDAAMEAAAALVPEQPLSKEVLVKNLHATCLPWFTMPSGDTRSLLAEGAWWGHCEKNFEAMYIGCGFSPGQARRAAPALRGLVLQPGRYTLYPDAVETLAALQKRGYRNYILSNNFPELGEIIAAKGLAPYLSGVLVSGKAGFEKPRPEIFEMAKKMAGSAEVWMIGDNPRDDIAGGAENGFSTVAVHGVEAPQALYSVNNLQEILAILQ